jgi:predicted  nucleic acid-binding Zn-ribbon protein
MWTRLMCSRNRQELETLQSKLSKAGIPSEIRCNSVAANRGIIPLEIVVDERDLFRASKVCQGRETAVSADDATGSPGGGRTINGFVKSEESELVTEAEVVPSPSTEPPREENPGRGHETGGAEPGGEFAQATALLERIVEELLVAESKSIDHCSSLEEKVKTLDESLAQARADLAGEVSNRSSAEKKLTEVCEARALLEKEMQALEVRFKALDESLAQARADLAGEVSNRSSAEKKLAGVCEARASLEEEMQALEVRFKECEQTLAASQARLESQTREFSDQQATIANLEKDVSSRDAQLERIAESLTKARAGMEQEKDLRLAAEQKSGDLAAALKSLECQLAQQARQRDQRLNERRDEQEQMRICVGKVNDLCNRVSAVLAARKKQ